MKTLLLPLLAAACYVGLEAPEPSATTTTWDPPPLADDGSSDTSSSSSAEESGASESAGLAADAYDCIGTLVLEQLGDVLVVATDASALELQPLQPGEGFTCMRVEVTLDPAPLAPSADACPVYAALASIRGTTPGGEDLAAAFVHAYDADGGDCVRGADRLAIGNFREFTDDVPAITLDAPLTVRLLVQPFVSRIDLLRDDIPLASASADLFPATVDDTRDPLVRLGLPRVADGTIVPWHGARYSDLRIFAEPIPP